MSNTFSEQLLEHRLSLADLAQDLKADGHLTDEDLVRIGLSTKVKVHPLVFLADQRLPDAATPGADLTMERLLLWLGNRVGQAVYRIDPLKINVTAVSDVMSKAFAEHHHILAVEVNDGDVVIASAEPFVHSWESNLEHVLRKPIRRVLADPREILRHTADFYSMAGSVRGARSSDQSTGVSGPGNLEQMLEIGSKNEPDANDQHIVKIVDWLLQYA
ncbi:MAG: type II/IV secretion system protein, partial [Halioglobus sp.]|nr:type II/IV secretion system protein [Halioglobus sp.]